MRYLICCFLGVLACRGGAELDADRPKPVYRVDAAGFNADARDIKAVCDSAAQQLWYLFPDYKIERFVVSHNKQGPIVLHRRNDKGEIVMQLNTGGTSWSQYAYQFSHEFCHILCGFDQDESKHEWFEETICEMASIYVMREMAKSWKEKPPYRNWKDYRDALRNYADDIERKQADKRYEIHLVGLPAYYEKNRAKLEGEHLDRARNAAIAATLLPLVEAEPTNWEAFRWLNHKPAAASQTFTEYLQLWHAAAPKKHHPFIKRVAAIFGVALTKD